MDSKKGRGLAAMVSRTLRAAGFKSRQFGTLAHPGGKEHAKAMYEAFTSFEGNPHLKLVSTFPLTVPQDYCDATRLLDYWRKASGNFSCFNSDVTDGNFCKTTAKLLAGQKYSVMIFQVQESVSFEACLAHYRRNKAVLVGPQGLTLAYELGSEYLPANQWMFCLDDKVRFLKKPDDQHHMMPFFSLSKGSLTAFSLHCCESGLSIGDCLICFCPIR